MRPIANLVVLVALASPALAAGSISPTTALPLAAIVGEHDPALSQGDKAMLAALLEGNARTRAERTTIVVAAPSIVCRESDVAITERSCELVFGTRRVTITGRAAHELNATLIEAGARGDGAAGSIYTGVSDLRCTVSPAVVLDNGGGGVGCTFGPAK